MKEKRVEKEEEKERSGKNGEPALHLFILFSPSTTFNIQMIKVFQNSIYTEVQQRSCEYGSLFNSSLSSMRSGLFEPMPIVEEQVIRRR